MGNGLVMWSKISVFLFVVHKVGGGNYELILAQIIPAFLSIID